MEKPHWLSISLLPQSITHGGCSTGCTFPLSSLAHLLGATPPNVWLKMEFATFTSPPGDFSAHQEVNKTLPVTTPPPLSPSFLPQSVRPRRCACVVTRHVCFNQHSQIFCARWHRQPAVFFSLCFLPLYYVWAATARSLRSVLCMSLRPSMSCPAHIRPSSRWNWCRSSPLASERSQPSISCGMIKRERQLDLHPHHPLPLANRHSCCKGVKY